MPTEQDTQVRLLDRKPHVLTAEQVARWNKVRNSAGRHDFGCLLCGNFFQAGDTMRFVFCNHAKSAFKHGNFFVCGDCDADDADCIERAVQLVSGLNPILMARVQW
jgi:hypothetical protein